MTRRTPSFDAEQFTPTCSSTAEDKAKLANKLARFILGGCKPDAFNDTLYKRLHYMFGHIAEYNEHGFRSSWFTSATQRLRFIRSILAYPCYGQPDFTWSDVEKVIQRWVREESLEADFAEAARVENLDQTTRTARRALASLPASVREELVKEFRPRLIPNNR